MLTSKPVACAQEINALGDAWVKCAKHPSGEHAATVVQCENALQSAISQRVEDGDRAGFERGFKAAQAPHPTPHAVLAPREEREGEGTARYPNPACTAPRDGSTIIICFKTPRGPACQSAARWSGEWWICADGSFVSPEHCFGWADESCGAKPTPTPTDEDLTATTDGDK